MLSAGTTLEASHVEGVLNDLLRETGSGLPIDLTRWSIESKRTGRKSEPSVDSCGSVPDLVRSYLGRAFGLPADYCSGPASADPQGSALQVALRP